MSKKDEPDPYVESETARIDDLMKELRKQKKDLLEGMNPQEAKLSPRTVGRIIGMSMGYYINSLLGGKRGMFLLDAGVPMWGNNWATFSIHGLWDLDHEQLSALASTEYHSDTPEDGSPVFSTRVVVCDQHINCMILEVETFFSDNDWKKLTAEDEK